MPIDPSIAMGYQPIKLDNPINSLAQIMQLEGARNQNRLSELQFQQHKQTQDETNALNSLYASAIGPDGKVDRSKLLQGAASRNLGSKIPGLQKGFLETDKAQGEVDEQKFKMFTNAMKVRKDELGSIRTAEDAKAWHRGNHTNPVTGPMLENLGISVGAKDAEIDAAFSTPEGARDWINKSSLGMDKFVELNKPSYHTQNSGDKTSLIAVNGLGGAPTTVSQATIKESEAQRLAREQQAAEAEKGRAVTIRGQNLTNDRAKESNTLKAGEKKATEDLTKGSQLASFDTMLGTLDRLSAHPGLPKTVGLRSVLPTIPGGDSANFQAELNTFQSQAFIPMVAQLKGMGALSDAEGKKLTQAVGALDPKMGEAAFRQSIARIKADMEAAYARVAGKPREGGASGDFGSKPTGKVVDFGSLK